MLCDCPSVEATGCCFSDFCKEQADTLPLLGPSARPHRAVLRRGAWVSRGPLSKDLQPHNLSGVLVETSSQIPLHPPPPGSALTVLARQHLLGHPRLLHSSLQAAFVQPWGLTGRRLCGVYGPQRHVQCGRRAKPRTGCSESGGAMSPRRPAQSSGFMTVTGSLGCLGDKGAMSPCAEPGASRPQEGLISALGGHTSSQPR